MRSWSGVRELSARAVRLQNSGLNYASVKRVEIMPISEIHSTAVPISLIIAPGIIMVAIMIQPMLHRPFKTLRRLRCTLDVGLNHGRFAVASYGNIVG